MKNLTFSLLLLFSISTTFAQTADQPLKLTFGFSAIDAFSTNAQNQYETGALFEDYFNISENWNLNNSPNYFSASYFLEERISLAVRGNLNQISKLGKTPVSKTYMSLDFAFQYSLISDENFNLYASAGAGKYWMDIHSSGTVNAGLGVDYWFTDSMAFTFESNFKHTATSYGVPHIYHSFGLSIR